MSTLEGYHEYIRGYHDACGGYHEYIGGCSVLQGDIMMHVGNIMSTSRNVQYLWFSIQIERLLSPCSPTCIMISLDVLNISPMYPCYPPMY